MLVNKEEIIKLYKEGKVKDSEGLDGILKKVMKDIIETLYQAELTEFLGYSPYDKSNKHTDNSRNGYTSKQVRSILGEIDLNVPRDRKGGYDPLVIKKGQRDITGMEDKILSMYAKGMSCRDIQDHLNSIYGVEVSSESISRITDSVLEKAKEWQNRPLESIYAIVFLDAIFLKARVDGTVKNTAVYTMLGITLEGKKECLGIWILETESSKFWLGVLNELKNRGVKDVLIFATDGLPGFSDAISAVFPKAEHQSCLVHQMRNSLKYVSYKHRKELAKDLKKIYTSPTEEMGLLELDRVEEKWGNRYPHVIRSWRTNWDNLKTFYKYPPEIRRLIYTTNPIESFNFKLKKVCKTKGVFPTEDAILKLLYLAILDINKKWGGTIRNWSKIYPQLYIFFEERIKNAVQ
ncbi:IS256-like element ISSod18 family transposase [Desulfothermus okinawensis JCM 13304]